MLCSHTDNFSWPALLIISQAQAPTSKTQSTQPAQGGDQQTMMHIYLEAPGTLTLPSDLSLQQLAAHAEHVCIFLDTRHLQEQHSCPPLPVVCVSSGSYELQQHQRSLVMSLTQPHAKTSPAHVSALCCCLVPFLGGEPAQSRTQQCGANLTLCFCHLKLKVFEPVGMLPLCTLQASLCS